MKESPIIFSTPMVQAIMSSQKTQTRRIFKNIPDDLKDKIPELYDHSPAYFHEICPYGKTGDLLWVRETWSTSAKGWIYKADNPHALDDALSLRWKPSIHMQKIAARIWLKVKKVRVERLQDISESDAHNEGIETSMDPSNKNEILYRFYPCKDLRDDTYLTNPITSFYSLWKSIHSEESWQSNPWVWVISFEVLSTTGKPMTNDQQPATSNQ